MLIVIAAKIYIFYSAVTDYGTFLLVINLSRGSFGLLLTRALSVFDSLAY